jgi:hypothetical protein
VKSPSEGRRDVRVILAGLLMAGLCLASFPQTAAARRRRPSPSSVQSFDSVKPRLLNADTNPALRFPIAYIYRAFGPGISFGWLDITRKEVRYVAEQPASQTGKGFETTRAEIRESKIDKSGFLHLETSKGKYTIFYMPDHTWGDIRTGFFSNGYMEVVPYSKINRTGSGVIQQTLRDFDKMVAAVEPPPPPLPEVSLVVAPLTVEKGHPVTLSWTSTHATSAELEPGVGKVAPTGTTSVTAQETTDFVVTASGPGGTGTATAHVTVTAPPPAAPPTLILVDPAVETSGQTLEVHKEMLSIRGVATDEAGLPMVTINGVEATMKPRGAHSAEFWSDPAKLQAGENEFKIVATGPHGAQARVNFIARYSPPAPPPAPPAAPTAAQAPPNPKALSMQDILDLLKNFVPSERVANLVTQFGLKFTPTTEDVDAIRKAGGAPALIEALQQAETPAKPTP